MAGATESTVHRGDTAGFEAGAALVVGLAALLFAVSLAALGDMLSMTDRIAGFPALIVLGVLLVAMGLAVVGFGVASRLEYLDTDPSESAGLVAAGLFTVLWLAVGGLFASATLGLGTLGWVVVAPVAGLAAFAVTALPREDLGSTLPAGALALLFGAVLLSGLIGPSWSWSPAGFPDGQQVTFFTATVVPVMVQVAALVVGWSAAKTYGGFGARGRGVGAHVLIYLNAAAIIAVLVSLVAFVFYKGIGPATEGLTVGLGVGPGTTIKLGPLSYTVVWPVQWPFLMNGASVFTDITGVLPAVVGTAWLVIGAVVIAVPLGVGAAVFLTEYADRGGFTRVVEVATNALWSTPSIVYGLFGAAFLVPRFTPTPRKSLLSGMITLGFMLLPLVVITAREAMLAVPDEYRDASAALGVSRWQTIRSVVIPAAMPGIVTGVILGVGRIAGETAPLLLTMGGGSFVAAGQRAKVVQSFQFTATPPFVNNPELLRATTALPYQLYQVILTGTGRTSGVEDISAFGWGTALVLLAVVLSFYAIGIATRQYFRSKLKYE